MKHIDLKTQPQAVREFVQELSNSAQAAVLELDGRELIQVIPRKKGLPEDVTWTDEKNERRARLIDQDIQGTLSAEEREELERLQSEMLAYRERVAPLPLEELRQMHARLLKLAGKAAD